MTNTLIHGLYREGEKIADTKAPHDIPIAQRWEQREFSTALINPANRRKLRVIIVGSGLAGGAAAASLGEMGYSTDCFFYQDSTRRAHSVAAQDGISAVESYRNDNDSVYRLSCDTVKDGDCHAHEDNVYHLAEVSASIIDRCAARDVSFAREYGDLLDNCSFGGVQVSRTFYAYGQTGQQLLIGAYQALGRQVAAGAVREYAHHEMVELIVDEGKARSVIARDMSTGKLEIFIVDAVVLAIGGYDDVFFLSANAMGCNTTAIWRAYHKDAYFGNPCFAQTHPACIPQHDDQQSKLTLMSESLRNDGRIWIPKHAEDCERDPRQIPEEDRNYYLEHIYPSFGNLVPRDIASRQARNICDGGHGVSPKINGVARDVYLDFSDAINRTGPTAVSAKYGSLFGMYERITDDNPYEVPMRIYPAIHYTIGGLQVGYDLKLNLSGLYVAGEANFSDHGTNRLGASALMQGLSDGYFVLLSTINDYLAHCLHLPKLDENPPSVKETLESAQDRIDTPMPINGIRSVGSFHKESGKIMWEYCGMERTEEGLKKVIGMIHELRTDYWKNIRVPGKSVGELNQPPERAGRVADFMELGELMYVDALHREESCDGHFRTESQTPEDEALRHDDKLLYVAAWEYADGGEPPTLHKEDLIYNDIELKQRNYK